MEGQGCFYGRAGPFLWKGRTIFMEGQGGSKFDLAIQKLLIPGMSGYKRLFSSKYYKAYEKILINIVRKDHCPIPVNKDLRKEIRIYMFSNDL